MNQTLWIIVIISCIISLVGSALVILYFYKKRQVFERQLDSEIEDTDVYQRIQMQRKKWSVLIIFYLVVCFIFTAIILYQYAQGMDEERIFDCLAVLVGTVFFMIEAFSRKRTAKRRERATAHTTGTLVAVNSEVGSEFGSRSYYAIYEFEAEGETHQVRYSGTGGLKEGNEVDVYYVPGHPEVIYVPEHEKRNKRWTILLFGIGIIFPLFGLTASLFR